MISRLAQIHALGVASRASVVRYRNTDKPVAEIGRELGIDAIVDGSVQRVNGRVRVSVQLVDAATDRHLWAGAFDRESTNVLDLQAEIAQAIADEIRVQITPEEKARLQRVHVVKPEAQNAYPLGRYHYWKATESELKLATASFERAIQIQPDYAEAHAGLSQALDTLRQQGFMKVDDPRRRSAAERALMLHDNLAAAHAAMAAIKFEEWDWAATEREFRRALKLNPHSVDACGCYPGILAAWGRPDEATAVLDRVLKANPLSSTIYWTYSLVEYTARTTPNRFAMRSVPLSCRPRPAGFERSRRSA